LLQHSTLLAETLLKDIGGRYRTDVAIESGSDVGMIVVAILVVGLIAATIHFVFRRQKIDNSPIGLLTELCKAHGVSTSGTRLICEIAARSGLQHPGVMLLSQANFEAAVKSAQSKMKLDRGQTKTLGIVRRRLFSV
jgi:hypothetical protein